MRLLTNLLFLISLAIGVQSVCYTSGFDILFGKPIRSSPWGTPAKAGDCNLPVNNGGGGGGGGGNNPDCDVHRSINSYGNCLYLHSLCVYSHGMYRNCDFMQRFDNVV
ncbi:hypothetical protein E8E11_009019 [Didymella keratinophila]|nr:hypothetical protein E8E11_009019 [Didymella keratinophila]